MTGNHRKNKRLVELLDDLIEEHHLLKHPFYRAWIEGKLSRKSLQIYAVQYYQHVRAFPEHLRQLLMRSSGSLAEIVGENIAEELNPVRPHPMLWRQFARSLGVGESSLNGVRPLPGIAVLLETYNEIASQGNALQASACFYAYEAQVPEIAAQKILGLKCFYGITDPCDLAYFSVHQEIDVGHRAAWRGWIASNEHACEDVAAVLVVAERSLKSLWGALDAIWRCELCNEN